MAAKVRLCAHGCGQPITVGGPRRRYLPGHAKNSARAINPESFSQAYLERFWDFVRLAENAQCWEWTGPRDKQHGYGRLWIDNRKYLAHRVMWALTHGPLPGIVELLHRCESTGLGPSCVNPSHLMNGGPLGHALNAQDAASNGTLHRVLSASQVLELRHLHAAGRSANSLAKEFGVHVSTVQRVVKGTTWVHIIGDWVPSTIPAGERMARGGNRPLKPFSPSSEAIILPKTGQDIIQAAAALLGAPGPDASPSASKPSGGQDA